MGASNRTSNSISIPPNACCEAIYKKFKAKAKTNDNDNDIFYQIPLHIVEAFVAVNSLAGALPKFWDERHDEKVSRWGNTYTTSNSNLSARVKQFEYGVLIYNASYPIMHRLLKEAIEKLANFLGSLWTPPRPATSSFVDAITKITIDIKKSFTEIDKALFECNSKKVIPTTPRVVIKNIPPKPSKSSQQKPNLWHRLIRKKLWFRLSLLTSTD